MMVLAKIRHTCPQIAEVLETHDYAHMQQSASTSAALFFGDLAITSGLVHGGLLRLQYFMVKGKHQKYKTSW